LGKPSFFYLDSWVRFYCSWSKFLQVRTLGNNIFLTLVALLAALNLQFSFVLFTKRELFVSGIRHIVHLESYLSIGKQVESICLVLNENLKINNNSILGLRKDVKKYVDIVGIFLHFVVMSMFFVLLFAVFFILLDTDPISLLLKLLALNPTPGSFSSSFLLIFRLVLITLILYAALRSITFMMILAILVLKILLHCIELSKQKISKIWSSSQSYSNFQKHVNMYQKLHLVLFAYVGVFSSPFAFVIMSYGLVFEIASVFAVIRLKGLIHVSWPTYGCTIILAIVILLADAELPEAIRIFDYTEAILRKWKLKMTLEVRGNRRYYFKKINSFRPCSIHAGLGDVLFFPLRRSTKTTYYGLMVYYVVNTLIAVPESFTLRG
jgi:hypothetical protein